MLPHSLQHLETFLWQRNPDGINRVNKTRASVSRMSGGMPSIKRRGGKKAKAKIRTEKAEQRRVLVERVSTVLQNLESAGKEQIT